MLQQIVVVIFGIFLRKIIFAFRHFIECVATNCYVFFILFISCVREYAELFRDFLFTFSSGRFRLYSWSNLTVLVYNLLLLYWHTDIYLRTIV